MKLRKLPIAVIAKIVSINQILYRYEAKFYPNSKLPEEEKKTVLFEILWNLDYSDDVNLDVANYYIVHNRL